METDAFLKRCKVFRLPFTVQNFCNLYSRINSNPVEKLCQASYYKQLSAVRECTIIRLKSDLF